MARPTPAIRAARCWHLDHRACQSAGVNFDAKTYDFDMLSRSVRADDSTISGPLGNGSEATLATDRRRQSPTAVFCDVCFRTEAKHIYGRHEAQSCRSHFGGMLARSRRRTHLLKVYVPPIILKPNLLSHFVHKRPQLGLRRDPKSSKSFQEPQPALFQEKSVSVRWEFPVSATRPRRRQACKAWRWPLRRSFPPARSPCIRPACPASPST